MSGCGQEKPAVAAKPQSNPAPALLTPSEVTVLETPPEVVTESRNEPTVAPEAAMPPKYEGYTRAYRELGRIPPPVIISDQSGLPDPSAIETYLNNLGTGVRQLQAEKQAVEQSLAPGEKRAWKEYQRELQEQTSE